MSLTRQQRLTPKDKNNVAQAVNRSENGFGLEPADFGSCLGKSRYNAEDKA